MMFRIGQKVVCVDDSGMADHPNVSKVSALPIKGAIYTVRGFAPPDFLRDDLFGLLLEEIIGKIHPIWNEEYGFRQVRFRPIVERKTDIAIFKKMLVPASKQTERA